MRTWKEVRPELYTAKGIRESNSRISTIGKLIKARREQNISQQQLKQYPQVKDQMTESIDSAQKTAEVPVGKKPKHRFMIATAAVIVLGVLVALGYMLTHSSSDSPAYIELSNEVPFVMPDMRNMHYSTVRSLLNSLGLELEIHMQEVFSDAGMIDLVIETMPAPGEPIENGDAAIVQYGAGPETIMTYVPNLVGRMRSELERELERLNLVADFRYIDDESSEGTVIHIDRIGQEVQEGTRIVVHVSSGPSISDSLTALQLPTQITITSVTLNRTSHSLIVGQTVTLIAAVEPPHVENVDLIWTSSNSGIATVSTGGIVTAISSGTATITVRTDEGNHTATCFVTVTAPLGTVTIMYWVGDGSGASAPQSHSVQKNEDGSASFTLSYEVPVPADSNYVFQGWGWEPLRWVQLGEDGRLTIHSFPMIVSYSPGEFVHMDFGRENATDDDIISLSAMWFIPATFIENPSSGHIHIRPPSED